MPEGPTSCMINDDRCLPSHGCHSQCFSGLFCDKCKISWPIKLTNSQISPDSGLNVPLTAIPFTHLFMLSARQMQCTWIEFLNITSKKDFFENPASTCPEKRPYSSTDIDWKQRALRSERKRKILKQTTETYVV